MRQTFTKPAHGLLRQLRCRADRNDKAMEMILQKSLQNARASAYYCYLCGGLSIAGAVGAWRYLPSPFLIAFTSGCGLVFIVSGIWYGRIAKKQNP